MSHHAVLYDLVLCCIMRYRTVVRKYVKKIIYIYIYIHIHTYLPTYIYIHTYIHTSIIDYTEHGLLAGL